ncbi:MAG: winged helix-turn-helix domain-containing protein [Candidatus Heimdallarchaeaceae archaeon]
MDIPENLRKFVKETINRAKAIEFSSQDPFRAFGFQKNPFEKKVSFDEINILLEKGIINTNLSKIITLIADIDKSRQNNFFLDAVLFGYRGSGVSTLVEKAHELVKNEITEMQNSIIIDAKKNVTIKNLSSQPTFSFNNIINEVAKHDIHDEEIPLVIIDHADYLIDIFVTFLESFKYRFPKTSILFVFSFPAWIRLKSLITTINYTDQFYNSTLPAIELSPLDKKAIYEILSVRLSVNGNIQQPFSSEIVEVIAENSLLNLHNAIHLTSLVCKECFYNGYDKAYIELVNDISSLLDYTSFDEFRSYTNEEDSSRVFLLTLITLKSVGLDIGISYEELVSNLNIQKTTISYHLSQLLKKNIIVKRTLNRKAYYKLNSALSTITDLYLITEFSKKERRVKLNSFTRQKEEL